MAENVVTQTVDSMNRRDDRPSAEPVKELHFKGAKIPEAADTISSVVKKSRLIDKIRERTA